MHYAFTLDPQETVSFAQRPGGSDCECPQDRCFLKQNVFRLDLKEERLGAQHGGLGREFQVTGPMLSLMHGTVMKPVSVEHRECTGRLTTVIGHCESTEDCKIYRGILCVNRQT